MYNQERHILSYIFNTRHKIKWCHPEIWLMSFFCHIWCKTLAEYWTNTSNERIIVLDVAYRKIQWFLKLGYKWKLLITGFQFWDQTFFNLPFRCYFKSNSTFFKLKIVNIIVKSRSCHYWYFCWKVSKLKSAVKMLSILLNSWDLY